MTRAGALAAALALGCGADPIGVRDRTDDDYNRDELEAAVASFGAAGRTAPAFAALYAEVMRLRPGMDEPVALWAELHLLAAAVAPIEASRAGGIADRQATLGLTVWPFALAPAVAAVAPDGRFDKRAAGVVPLPQESASAYVERLCGDVLALDCKHVVPELQAPLVDALTLSRMTDRVRSAVASCYGCETEPAWAALVTRWETLDRTALADVRDAERQGAPSNWPMAGPRAEPFTPVPIATVLRDGRVLFDGVEVPPGDVVAALRSRAKDGQLAMALAPDARLAFAQAFLAEAHRAGLAKVAVLARDARYPYPMRAYWVAPRPVPRTAPRDAETVQVRLRHLDSVAAPDGLLTL